MDEQRSRKRLRAVNSARERARRAAANSLRDLERARNTSHVRQTESGAFEFAVDQGDEEAQATELVYEIKQ